MAVSRFSLADPVAERALSTNPSRQAANLRESSRIPPPDLPSEDETAGDELYRPNVLSRQFLDHYRVWVITMIIHLVVILVLVLQNQRTTGRPTVSLEMVTDDFSSLADLEELQFDTTEFEIQNLEQSEAAIEHQTESDLMQFDPVQDSGGFGGRIDGQGFDELVERLRKNGLDIVIVLDSTGSMLHEVQEVKSKIEWMSSTLFGIVDNTRIGVCTYRDADDQLNGGYVVKGQELTSNFGEIVQFLSTVSANGGGDLPEAVHRGLQWAVGRNQFRPDARKVILLFGDAPPHPEHRNACLKTAERFREYQQGFVSTITCHAGQCLPSFVEIAQRGGGEAWLIKQDEREIISQLMVLVFGSQYQHEVVNAIGHVNR